MQRSAFALGLIAFATQSPRAARAAAPVRIAVLGDSLALGTGATRADGGFIFRSFRSVSATRPGSSIDTVAIGGATVADVLRLQVARLAREPYDVVIVCVGGNDVVRGTAAAAFRTSYTAVLTRVRRAVPHAHIVCCGVPDVSISPIFTSERAAVQRSAAADDRSVRILARTSGATFVDLFAVSRGQRDAARFLGHDRFHPSDAGYGLLERVLTPALDGVLANAVVSARFQ